MNSKPITTQTVKPLIPEYKHDSDLVFENNSTQTHQGLVLNVCDMLQDVTDSKINNNSIYTLTQKKQLQPDVSLKLPQADIKYPTSFVTYMVYKNSTDFIYKLNDVSTSLPRYGQPQYLQIEESTDSSQTTRQYTISSEQVFTSLVDNSYIQNNRLFEVELLDKDHCRIFHDDGYTKTFLTYDDIRIPTSTCSFTTQDQTTISSSHAQVFLYTIDNVSGYMGLMKVIDDGSRTNIIHSGVVVGDTIVSDGKLVGEPTSPTQKVLARKSIAKIQPGSLVDTESIIRRSINTSWYNYKAWQDSRDTTIYRYDNTRVDDDKYRYLDQNSVEVDERITRVYGNQSYYTGSYTNQKNNYLIDCQYTNITGNHMQVNITPLKNQLTPQGNLAENSPHAVGDVGDFYINMNDRRSTDFRTYHKIFSGTNQNTGDDTLCLGYTSYTDQIELPGDKITYFHMPNVMKPFTWMNINYRRVPQEYPVGYPTAMRMPIAVQDSRGYDYEDFVGLLRAGAIAGSSPVNSDKIFKKRSTYRFFSPWGDSGRSGNVNSVSGAGDSHYGTWLCAWLRMTPDETSERKFGPMWFDRYYDDTKFSDNQVLDKPPNCIDISQANTSLLSRALATQGYVDVPSELRLERGVQYAYHHVGMNNTRTIIKSFDKYMFHKDVDQYTHVVSGVDTVADITQQDGYNVYKFTGEQYGKTKSPDPSHGDFRVSFWMHSDDWSSSFGHQVLGNYTNDGIAVENDNVITPVMITQNDDNVMLLNTHGKPVTMISNDRYTNNNTTASVSSAHATRGYPTGDVSIITSVSGYMYVNNFNLNGALTDTHQISGGLLNRKGVVKSVYAAETYIYTLFDNTSAVGRVDASNGTFLDLDITDFESIQVSGAPHPDFGSVPSVYYFIDDTLEAINNKPVYVGVNNRLETVYMYNAGGDYTTWLFTTDAAFLTGGESITPLSGSGVVPTTFGRTGEDPVNNVGTAFPRYSAFLPPVTYLTPATNNPTYDQLIYNRSGSLFVVDGDCACSTPPVSAGGTNMLYYASDNNIYAHPMAATQQSVYSAMSPVITAPTNTTIYNIKTDMNNDIWVFYDDNFIAKYDSEYNLLFNVSLSSCIDQSSTRVLSGHKMMDVVREFKTGAELDHRVIVFHKNEQDDLLDVINISLDGVVTLGDSVSSTGIDAVEMTHQKNMSCFNNINNQNRYKNNSLTFKFRSKNKYNQKDYVNISESFDVSKLAPGWHHLSFGFDANLKGIGYFYIDGLLARERSVLSTAELGKYGFTDVLSKFTTVGATQGYNNALLNKLLQQPGYYHSKNFMIKSLRMYNFNLFRDFIKTLAREHLPQHTMLWNVPSGRRSHLDHVEKFHLHRLPGYKTADFSVELTNTGVSGAAQQVIQDQLSRVISDFTPALANNTDIVWLDQPNTSSST